jgi:hypothetical protein
VSLDTALFYAGIAVEAAAILVLFRQKITRTLPVFSTYIVFSLLNDLGMLLVRNYFPHSYWTAFEIEKPLDSVLQFGVLVELAWSVLKPYRAALPRSAIGAVAFLVLLAGAAAWPVTGLTVPHNFPAYWRTLMRIDQSFSILRIFTFLGMAGLSQLLAIGWRNRELQVATGLGIYSIASMGAAVLHTHVALSAQFLAIEDLAAASYICSMVYWIWSFLQKEAPRQEFSPKMQNLLLTVAGAARANRVALDDLRKSKP